MIDKNVCPNCGQLYDTDLSKCPLCGAVPQVVEAEAPVQRKRITENERKQRRADRKEQEQEARRRKKDEQYLLDADQERQIEAEEALRKEEKRRKKEEKKAARLQRRGKEVPAAAQSAGSGAVLRRKNDTTPMPARMGRPPAPVYVEEQDRGRVPRVFLVLSCLLLLATLAIGGSYLLWKFHVVELPVYDRLAAGRPPVQTEAAAPETGESAGTTETDAGPTRPTAGDEILCRSLQLGREEITFDTAGDQTRLEVTTLPEEATEDRIFTSSDEQVVKVSPVGILTAVGPGEAVVTVTCGAARAECRVICTFEAGEGGASVHVDVDHLDLVKTDMTFFSAGENYVLTVTNVPAGTPVTWYSEDPAVATVDQGGHVVAVGAGTTHVVAQVGDLTAKCIVRCRFNEE